MITGQANASGLRIRLQAAVTTAGVPVRDQARRIRADVTEFGVARQCPLGAQYAARWPPATGGRIVACLGGRRRADFPSGRATDTIATYAAGRKAAHGRSAVGLPART